MHMVYRPDLVRLLHIVFFSTLFCQDLTLAYVQKLPDVAESEEKVVESAKNIDADEKEKQISTDSATPSVAT